MLRAADNPFAVHRVLRQRYRLSESAWTGLLERLARLGWRGALAGPKGSGKTTLLEDLGERLTKRGLRTYLLSLHDDRRALPSGMPRFGASDIVLCDGAEQLTSVDWWRLRLATSGARGLVITAHTSPRLPILFRCSTSPELLRDIIACLGVALSAGECATLHAAHAGNVREAIRELYDTARWWRGPVPPRPNTAPTAFARPAGGRGPVPSACSIWPDVPSPTSASLR
jgi:hypothetical protein